MPSARPKAGYHAWLLALGQLTKTVSFSFHRNTDRGVTGRVLESALKMFGIESSEQLLVYLPCQGAGMNPSISGHELKWLATWIAVLLQLGASSILRKLIIEQDLAAQHSSVAFGSSSFRKCYSTRPPLRVKD